MSHPGWTGAHVCKKTVVCVLSCICVCTHVLGTRVVRSERAPGCAGVGCTDADSPGHVLRPLSDGCVPFVEKSLWAHSLVQQTRMGLML